MFIGFGVEDAKLAKENGGIRYYRATDSYFKDEIDVKVVHNSVYTRIHCDVSDVDIDEEIDGVTDEYFHVGEIPEKITAAVLD
jgi:hypothetical protein